MNDNSYKVVEVDINEILPNRFQPRIQFDEEEILELSDSIKEHGVIQPIVVRTIGDKYEIIAGERRYKASVLAGKETVPVIIKNLNDKDSAEIALIENIQRKNLTPIEEALSYKKILDMGYLTQEGLATKLGKSQSAVANKVRLLNLSDEVQEALLDNKISERHARSLLRLKSSIQQNEMLEKIISQRLTVRKTDDEIDKVLEGRIEEKGEVEMNNEINQIPNVVTQPGNSFDIFGGSATPAAPVMPEIPSAPVIETPVAPVMPEFVSAPVVETPVAPVIPEIPSVPVVETPVAPVMPEFVSAPVIETPVAPVIPEIPSAPVIETPVAPVMPEFVSAPVIETPVAPVIPEIPSVPVVETPVAPVMPEFVSAPVIETPVAPVIPEIPSAPVVETPVAPVIPEIPSAPVIETPVAPVMPEFVSAPVIETPVAPVIPEIPSVPVVETPTLSVGGIQFDANGNVIAAPVIPEIPSVPVVETPTSSVEEIPQTAPIQEISSISTESPASINTNVSAIEPIIITDYNKQYDPIMPGVNQAEASKVDFKEIINEIRECSKRIEKFGYKIDVEEYDLSTIYQVVFKIEK